MPPKAKYTREEIVEIAVELAAKRGIDALNARNLAAALGTSTRPLFTAFKNMGELIGEVNSAAMKRFEEYAGRFDPNNPAFKTVGMQMILFAAEQPKLFQLLFMSESENSGSFDDMFGRLGVTSRLCIDYIMRDYGLDLREAELLFRSAWVYTFGICALIAKGVCRYSENEVSEMLSVQFNAIMGLILSGKAFDVPEYEKGLSPQEFKEKFTAQNGEKQ